MSVLFVYSPGDRSRVDPFARGLEDCGYEVTMGHIGLKVNGPEWLDATQEDVASAAAVVVFITSAAITDESVSDRLEMCRQARKSLFPVMVDSVELPPSLALFLRRFQSLPGTDVARAVKFLAKALPKPKRRVECFLSYSRSDALFAKRLKNALNEQGITCWRDEDDIPAGASWDREIETALARSSHVLVVISQHSVDSANVADEVGFARERKKAIVPLLLDDAPLPMRVHRAQAIDFRSDFNAAFAKLASNLGVGDDDNRGSQQAGPGDA